MIEPQGTCDPAFAAVRDAFAQNFADGLELGASLSISVDGRNVVDLWGGHPTRRGPRPWDARHDRVRVLVHEGRGRDRHDVGGRAAASSTSTRRWPRYWPEFAAEGKGDIPVRWLLTHEAGLPAIAKRMPLGSLSDWDAMTSALAAQAPWWEPGTAHGYHGVTFGHLDRRGAAARDRARLRRADPRRAGRAARHRAVHAAARRRSMRAPPT